ncbi:SurA N-terminal domain-containing protein [Pseudalkalibacillus salsuginis]|uniref:SurA N-terminal domain-containing protein n=1 Tax=Pseudalkalibacillus salsuginis TaxID=2910972 RepID=UPI001F1C275B|nr:SurA N-terminal domain-containing protein [Pseudalkalibacillus salsuginis]MCF6411761.1 SurA N-terminal domain-containing protein [Pseudalkalibacillus salsuginis]
MRKIMYTALVAVFVLALAACGGNEESKGDEKNKDKQQQNNKDKEKTEQMEEMQKKMEKQQVDEDKVVAQVNDKEIKGIDYNRALGQMQMQYQQMGQDPTSKEVAEQLKKQVVTGLVDFEVIIQEAESKGYKASEEDVNKQIDEIKGQFDDEKKFEEALKTNKLTEDQLKEQIADQIQYETYVEKEIPTDEVSEEEMKKYYDQMKQAQGDQAPKYEEVKDQLKQQVQQQQQQEKVAQKVKELKKDAEISVKI